MTHPNLTIICWAVVKFVTVSRVTKLSHTWIAVWSLIEIHKYHQQSRLIFAQMVPCGLAHHGIYTLERSSALPSHFQIQNFWLFVLASTLYKNANQYSPFSPHKGTFFMYTLKVKSQQHWPEKPPWQEHWPESLLNLEHWPESFLIWWLTFKYIDLIIFFEGGK